MRRLFLLAAFIILCAGHAKAQGGNTLTINFPGVPSGNCVFLMLGVNQTNGDLYNCDPMTSMWVKSGGSGGSGTVNPAATGDVGVYSAATAISGYPLFTSNNYASGNHQLETPNLNTPVGGFGSFQNFLQNTECLDCGVWTYSNASTTGTTFIPPNNTISASGDADVTSSVAGGYAQQCYDTGTALTGRTFTYSVWVSAPTAVTGRMLILSTTPTTAVSQTISIPVYTSSFLWTRVHVTGTFGVDAGTSVCARFVPVDGGTGEAFAWGHQLEEGSDPSVYVSLETQVQSARHVGGYLSSADAAEMGYSLGFNALGSGCNDCFAIGIFNVLNNAGLAFSMGQVNVSSGTGAVYQFGQWLSNTTGTTVAIGEGISDVNPLVNSAANTACLAMNTDTCSLVIGNAGGGMGSFSPISIPGQKSSSGQRYVCITTTGQLVSSATACVGT